MTLAIRLAIVTADDVVFRGLSSVIGDLAQEVLLLDRAEPAALPDTVDVVLYDVVALQHGDGSDLVRLVKETDAAVLAVSRELRPDLADRALEKGVDGAVSLAATSEEIQRAVLAAAAGDLMGDGEPGSLDYTGNPDARAGAGILSERESDVLALVAAGHSNDEIARRLFLSINTVKTYVRSAYRKIGASSRAQAVGWALEHGFHR